MKTFENWLNEIEGYSLRKERVYDDLVKYEHGSYTARWNMVLDWLQAAFEAGAEPQKNTLDSYKREVRMLRDEIQEMLDAIKSAQFDELILPEINDKNKPTVESKKLPKREK